MLGLAKAALDVLARVLGLAQAALEILACLSGLGELTLEPLARVVPLAALAVERAAEIAADGVEFVAQALRVGTLAIEGSAELAAGRVDRRAGLAELPLEITPRLRGLAELAFEILTRALGVAEPALDVLPRVLGVAEPALEVLPRVVRVGHLTFERFAGLQPLAALGFERAANLSARGLEGLAQPRDLATFLRQRGIGLGVRGGEPLAGLLPFEPRGVEGRLDLAPLPLDPIARRLPLRPLGRQTGFMAFAGHSDGRARGLDSVGVTLPRMPFLDRRQLGAQHLDRPRRLGQLVGTRLSVGVERLARRRPARALRFQVGFPGLGGEGEIGARLVERLLGRSQRPFQFRDARVARLDLRRRAAQRLVGALPGDALLDEPRFELALRLLGLLQPVAHLLAVAKRLLGCRQTREQLLLVLSRRFEFRAEPIDLLAGRRHGRRVDRWAGEPRRGRREGDDHPAAAPRVALEHGRTQRERRAGAVDPQAFELELARLAARHAVEQVGGRILELGRHERAEVAADDLAGPLGAEQPLRLAVHRQHRPVGRDDGDGRRHALDDLSQPLLARACVGLLLQQFHALVHAPQRRHQPPPEDAALEDRVVGAQLERRRGDVARARRRQDDDRQVRGLRLDGLDDLQRMRFAGLFVDDDDVAAQPAVLGARHAHRATAVGTDVDALGANERHLLEQVPDERVAPGVEHGQAAALFGREEVRALAYAHQRLADVGERLPAPDQHVVGARRDGRRVDVLVPFVDDGDDRNRDAVAPQARDEREHLVLRDAGRDQQRLPAERLAQLDQRLGRTAGRCQLDVGCSRRELLGDRGVDARIGTAEVERLHRSVCRQDARAGTWALPVVAIEEIEDLVTGTVDHGGDADHRRRPFLEFRVVDPAGGVVLLDGVEERGMRRRLGVRRILDGRWSLGQRLGGRLRRRRHFLERLAEGDGHIVAQSSLRQPHDPRPHDAAGDHEGRIRRDELERERRVGQHPAIGLEPRAAARQIHEPDLAAGRRPGDDVPELFGREARPGPAVGAARVF